MNVYSYKILAPKIMEEQKDPKKACGACLESIPLDEELYRLGNTKACEDVSLDQKKTYGFFLNVY